MENDDVYEPTFSSSRPAPPIYPAGFFISSGSFGFGKVYHKTAKQAPTKNHQPDILL
jgi:hypothetical protein